MNYKMMGRFISLILLLEGVFMLVPSAIAFLEKSNELLPYLAVAAALIVLGITLRTLTRKAPKGFFAKEGFFCVSVSWILLSVFGALPLVFSGATETFTDALFEIVSGFTTTGASVIPDVEALGKATLYWRSFSHWLGGMGVLVLLLAITPSGGEGYTIHLMRAESPGPSVDKLVPKIKDTARVLYLTYLALTALNFVFLLHDLTPFDALCTAFGTAGTGGFGIYNDSLASCSAWTQNVTTVFMLLFSVNFSCYWLMLRGNFKSVWKDEELRFFLCIVLIAGVGIGLDIHFDGTGLFSDFADAFRTSFFSVASVISTTGYGVANVDAFPMFSKAVILLLMVTGACAGSTCGGLKLSRVLLLLKSAKRNLSQLLHRGKVEKVMMNGSAVGENVLSGTHAYFTLYAMILGVSFLLLSLADRSVSPTSAFTAVLNCFNNIGFGFESAYGCFVGFSTPSKWILIFDMLAGRLEIFPLLMLFSRSMWKSDK